MCESRLAGDPIGDDIISPLLGLGGMEANEFLSSRDGLDASCGSMFVRGEHSMRDIRDASRGRYLGLRVVCSKAA